MKRDCPLNISRLTYGATAPSSVATPVLTIGLVVQHMGREMSSKGAQSGMGEQTAGGRGQGRAFVLSPRDAQASNTVLTGILTICSR